MDLRRDEAAIRQGADPIYGPGASAPVAFGFLVANLCLEFSKGIPNPLKRIVCLRAAQLIGCPF